MRSDIVLLLDVYLAAQNILEFTHGMTQEQFTNSKIVQSAVIREFQVIGEAARMISEEGMISHPEIEWRKIAGMRNRMIHEYFDIRVSVVWITIQQDIPALVAQLEPLLPSEDTSS